MLRTVLEKVRCERRLFRLSLLIGLACFQDMVVLVFLEKELQEAYLLELKKAALPNLHNVHMYHRNHSTSWGYHIQTVAPLFTVNGTDGLLICNAGMFYWSGYLSQWGAEFAETFSLPLVQDQAVPQGGRFLSNGEGICIITTITTFITIAAIVK